MYEYPEGDTEGEIASKWILHGSRYEESAIGDQEIDEDEESSAKKSELFHDHREDEIPLYLRQIAKLLNRFAKSESKEST